MFFAEFLATAGVFDRWVQTCPLHYSSPNASRPRDVLGILAGSKRYAHIAGVRGDAVAAKALGLRGMVSEDSVRRALSVMVPAASEPWMREALMAGLPRRNGWVFSSAQALAGDTKNAARRARYHARMGTQAPGRREHWQRVRPPG